MVADGTACCVTIGGAARVVPEPDPPTGVVATTLISESVTAPCA